MTTRLSHRHFILWLGALGSVGIGVAAGLTKRRWWERIPEGLDEGPQYEPQVPGRWKHVIMHPLSFGNILDE